MWADDETGSSSAGPWSTPSAIAWPRGSLSAGRGIGRRLGLPSPPPPAEDEVDDADDDGGEHRGGDVPQRVLPFVPARPDLVADKREQEHPRDAAQHGVEREAPERHPGDAGGQRDERPHDRQHAAEEHRPGSPALEPPVGAVDARLAHVQPLAVTLDELDAPEIAHGVGDPRADQVAQDARGGHFQERELPAVDVEAGEQHRRLRWDRDAGALGGHQAEDAGQAEVADHVGRPVGDRVRDGGDDEHERSRVVPPCRSPSSIPPRRWSPCVSAYTPLPRAFSTRAGSSSGPRWRGSSASWLTISASPKWSAWRTAPTRSALRCRRWASAPATTSWCPRSPSTRRRRRSPPPAPGRCSATSIPRPHA